MIATLILSISLIISSTIILVTNPLPIGLMILLLSLILTTSTSIFSSSWLAFLVFLIYIRGILILFSYFIALSPNQIIAIYPEHLIITISSIFPILLILFNSMPPMTSSSESAIPILYSKSLAITPIILAAVLLITLVIVVKLTILNKGPLRPFNYV